MFDFLFCGASPSSALPELLKSVVNKLLNIEDKHFELNRVQSPLAVISLWGKKRTKPPWSLSSINPLFVCWSATVAFPIQWLLVRDANVFTDDVALEYCLGKPPFIHRPGIRTQAYSVDSSSGFESTEDDGHFCLARTTKALVDVRNVWIQ